MNIPERALNICPFCDGKGKCSGCAGTGQSPDRGGPRIGMPAMCRNWNVRANARGMELFKYHAAQIGRRKRKKR